MCNIHVCKCLTVCEIEKVTFRKPVHIKNMFQQETPSWKENVQKADYDNMAALILTSEFPFAYVYMHNHYIQ
jgi:hypothetical protein